MWALRRNDVDWIRDIFAFIFVFGLLLGLVWLSRSKTTPVRAKWPFKIKSKEGVQGRLALVDRLVLTPANSLHLVRADTRTFLLAVHSAGVVVVSELTPPEECAK